jgi:signal transduction histidine kinase
MTDNQDNADYSLRILWSLARWIEDQKGADALAKIARTAGVRPEDFDGSTRWVSHEQFEKILSAAYELAGDEEAFKEVFAYRFKESYGAFRYMMWAVSIQQMCEAAAKFSSKVVTNVGRFEVLRSATDSFAFRYRSTRAESRLMCLSRQVAWVLGPTLWGHPPADLTEHACIAKGDPFCEYHMRWFARRRVAPLLIGALVGGLLALAVISSGLGLGSTWLPAVVLPALGLAVGYIVELRRTDAKNIGYAEELNRVLRELGQAEAETRAEIVALHQRQREWIRLMEQQVTERTTTLERVVEGLDTLQQNRVSTLRGFSHDLRNPLFVVRGNTQYLRERFPDGDEGEALRDMESAAAQIEAMLSKLMEVATQETGFVRLTPKPLAVAPLADLLRRRLRALVHGRDIKVSVFCTRESPDEIVVDPLVFDRVVDNLLTNAAKYTERGSILLELSGSPAPPVAANDVAPKETSASPAFLTLKLSDTGEGIAPEQVSRIFRPRPQEEPSRPNSYGIGLSSVVRLLAQIGGRIDVMSKPGVGTTFWAHFPVAPPTSQRRANVGDDSLESIITRVVTIRKAEGT